MIYVAGNHEFYHGSWYDTLTTLTGEVAKYPNIHFLENECVTIGDYVFVGCTLWTDMNRGDPITLYTVANGMNDFRVIRNDGLGYTKLRPAHAISRHCASLKYIQKTVDDDPLKQYVVVTHHAPSPQSIHDQYKGDHHLNGGYASNLVDFILDRPQIKMWTHGHVHCPHDYMIGSTRIVCNPRGYERFETTGWNATKIVEL